MSCTKIYLDTNAIIFLSGCPENDLLKLSGYMEKNTIELFTSHVQIDELYRKDEPLSQKMDHALKRLISCKITVNLVATNEVVLGISRVDECKLGSDEIGKIDEALREEINRCMGRDSKGTMNIARDALIALSALNHDYFITGDYCMYKSWNKLIESNASNKEKILKVYSIPKIIHRKKPNSVRQAILEIS
jgi:hypothetical protein